MSNEPPAVKEETGPEEQARESLDEKQVVDTSRRSVLAGGGALAMLGPNLATLTNPFGPPKTKQDDTKSQEKRDNTTNADGQCVYLVFGADIPFDAPNGLDSWIEDNKKDIKASSQQSTSEVIQFQDIFQVNVNQQENAVAIAIDGGEAEAIQATEQTNTSAQSGSAHSINAEKEKKNQTFTDVENAYIVFAEETECREFSGWVVDDDVYQSEQSAEATVDQTQEVDQLNYNSQSTAVAIAENESYSQAVQLSHQENENIQDAEAVAANIGDSHIQTAESTVEQAQEVSQLNVNEQGVAIAIAIGSESVAEARQLSLQSNLNEQIAEAKAINFDPNPIDFDPKSVKEVTAKAGMTGDFAHEDMNRQDDGSSQSNGQVASATIIQEQSVGQENINLQNAAIAVALDNSEAEARQASYQANFNAQIASATAVNVEDGGYNESVVLSGADMNGDESWAVAYENGESETQQQTVEVDIEQVQLIEQLNVNEQFGAIAFATARGESVAEQLNFQVNENVQMAEATAVNVRNDGNQKDGIKNDSKTTDIMP